MTLGDLIALAWRRRVLTAACLVLVAVALLVAVRPVEAWNARVSVVLLVPQGTPGNPIAKTTTSLIATTGVVARAVNGPEDLPETVSSDLNLASIDARPGWTLRQPNAGGQWDVHYEEPRLDVKAWGHSQGEAAAQVSEALKAVDLSLASLQDSHHVAQNQRIRLQLSPAQPVFTVQAGSRVRAVAATGVLGLLGTLGVLVGAERLAVRRRSAAEPRGAGSAAPDELADRDG